jgi:hypothetical protein
MKALLILALAALLANTGCSTNKHLLEPGVDKYKDRSPEHEERAGCCNDPDCPCGRNHIDPNCAPCRRGLP